MTDYEQILKIKEDVEARLHSLSGVHAVGIGRKVVDGKPTDELAITVFVVDKKPLDQLSSGQVVPAEIDGIKTDVVQMPIPRLHFAASPSNLTADIDSNKLGISFSGSHKPGAGLVVTVEFTATPSNLVPPNFAITYRTSDNDTLESIATGVAKEITQDAVENVTAAGSGTHVAVTAGSGTTVAITRCTVGAIDDEKYFKDWVRGGIQIQPGGQESWERSGTLGCVATTAATAQFPQGMVVGITCQHVLGLADTESTNLTAANSNGNVITLGVSDATPIPAGTVLEISFLQLPTPEVAYYLTKPGDTPATIVTGMIAVINSLAISGVTVTLGGTSFTVNGTQVQSEIFPPAPADSDSDLKATVSGNVITFSGSVSDGGYGIFTDVHPGGIAPSFSVFINPAEDTAIADVAKAVAQAVTDLKPAATRGAVTATAGMPGPGQITFTNAEDLECTVTSDTRVGQPDASFCSRCSPCCSHRIGRILDSRLDVDVALIQLDAGLNYKPEIQELGLVSGVAAPIVTMNVFKRGRTTGKTPGVVQHLAVTGILNDSPRQYTNAFIIQSAPPTVDPFSTHGDSGAAIVGPGRRVVGILFSGVDTFSWAMPITQVISAFPALQLNLAPAPASGQAADAVRVVPKSAAQMAALEPDAIGIAAAQDVAPAMLGGRLGRRMEEVEQEITASPAGREYAALVRHHFSEAHRLVTNNRRVAATWKRNGGPQIIEALMGMPQRRDQRLPAEVNGKPLTACLMAIKGSLSRYASPALAADLTIFMRRLEAFAGFSYAQMLTALESGGAE
ncbi:MAG: trypsin-like serine protease [Acidobacteriaceae bacterium]